MKKIISLALIAVLCAALALATGCTSKEPTGDKDTVSLTIENIYGSSELTEDQIAAFQNSGEITLYTDKADIAKGEYDEDTKSAHEFYKKYYGLTIKYKYQAYGDNLTKFMVDYANGDAPDMITLDYRRWPKAGNREVVYSLSELEKKGVGEEIVKEIMSVSQKYFFLSYIGWDVVPMKEGMYILEGNTNSDVNLLQIHRGLLQDQQIKNFYRSHQVID